MITLTKPRWSDIERYIVARRESPLSYDPADLPGDGESGTSRRSGTVYRCDRERVLLGQGRTVFTTACQAIREWRMFPDTMAEVYWPNDSLSTGYVLAVLFRGPGFWSLNPARIVERFDTANRFGFAYGTLEGHLARGRESFAIRIDDEQRVWYELTAHSRPQHWIGWLGYPYLRFEQARFRRLSARSVQRYVQTAGTSCQAG